MGRLARFIRFYTDEDDGNGGEKGVLKTVSGALLHVVDVLAKPAKKFVATLEPIQSGSGDPSPENIRPITGHTGANVVMTGKNLLPFPYVHDTRTINDVTFTVNNDGSVTATGTPTATASFYILNSSTLNLPDLDGKTVALSGCPSGGSTSTFYISGFRLANSGEGSVSDTGTGKTFVWSTGTYTNYNIAINIKVGTVIPSNGLTFYPQLELGSTAYTYEEYKAQTIPVTFPDAAGTVYGGTLTNEGGEWNLRVDSEMTDLGSLNWKAYGQQESYGGLFYSDAKSSKIKYGSNDEVYTVCEIYLGVPNRMSGTIGSVSEMPNSSIRVRNGDGRLYVRDDTHISDNGAAFTTAVTGKKLVYKLAEPIEHTLTESQALTLLKGENNIWVDDSDDLELTYYAKAEETTP